MAKLDLKQSTGLPLTYNGIDILPQSMQFHKKTTTVGIDEIRPQLLNKELNCPEIFYKKYMHLTDGETIEKKKLSINYYVLYPNLAGIEYVKTRASRCNMYPRIIEVAHGGGKILLQKFNSPLDNQFIITTAVKGSKYIIPAGYSFCLANTRQNSKFVVEEIHFNEAKIRVVLADKSGMAYYVIRKNAKQEVVRNPNYKIFNKPEIVNWEEKLKEYGITPKTPVIKQIMRKYDKFKWLFEENSVHI